MTKPTDGQFIYNPNGNSKYVGNQSAIALKLKSNPKVLNSGESMKMSYGFEPTTLYKRPTIHLLNDVTKNTTQNLKTRVSWTDQTPDSTGGVIEFYAPDVNNKNKMVLLHTESYTREDEESGRNVIDDGEFFLDIDAKHFIPGVKSQLKLVIKDSLYDSVSEDKKEEHTSERLFNVINKRIIPISHETQFEEPLVVPEGTQKSIELLDGDSGDVAVPKTVEVGGKPYPLDTVKPNDSDLNLNKTEGKLQIFRSGEKYAKGIKIIYKLDASKININYIDMHNKKIAGAPHETIQGGVGMPYNFGKELSPGVANPRNKIIDIDKYTYVDSTGSPLDGVFPGMNQTIDVNLRYKKNNPTVTTHYLQLDRKGNPTNVKVFKDIDNKIREEPKIIEDAEIGSDISLVTPASPFNGYEYKSAKTKIELLDGTPVVDGKVPETDFTVTYYYQPMEVITVPDYLSFGQNHKNDKDVTYGVSDNKISYVDVLNTYENSQWQILASSEGLKSQVEGTTLFADIFYKDSTGIKMISNDVKPITDKSNELKAKLPMSSKNEQSGLFVKVREDGVKGIYSGKIKFSLQSAP